MTASTHPASSAATHSSSFPAMNSAPADSPGAADAAIAVPPAGSAPARELALHAWMSRIAAMYALRPDTVRMASADASFRRYFRIDGQDGAPTPIVVDAPPARAARD